MDAQTLEALNGSIEKWEKIVSGTGADAGADNCPLCNLFNTEDSDPMCAGCPVMERTGKQGCDDTPYQEWRKSHPRGVKMPYHAITSAEISAAKSELEFLRSLLPVSSAYRDT